LSPATGVAGVADGVSDAVVDDGVGAGESAVFAD
jgi:hypothetical protein